jgi:hypothetical protein
LTGWETRESIPQIREAAMIAPFTGRCLCRAVTYRCDAEPLWQGHCHCESCRRATASPFTSFLGVSNGTWRWTGETPATYASSAGTWRDFCPHCGTQMAYRNARWPDEMHFYAATLDEPAAYQPTSHYFASERLPWVHLCDGLPLS